MAKKRRTVFDDQAAKYLSGQQKSEKSSEPKRDRTWDAQRSKATYDLPPELITRIREIAGEIGQGGAKVKINDVARLLLEAGIERYEAGALDIKMRPTGFKLFDD